MSPNHFELHAGSANKRPPDYLYLENGRTLRDVLNACKDAPLESVKATILHAIGSSSAENPIPLNCQKCRGIYITLNSLIILYCSLKTN